MNLDDRSAYKSNPLLKQRGVQIDFTREQVQEVIKCSQNPEYFLENYIKDVPEDKRAPVLVFSGKDLTDVQEELLNERVVGLVKKDDVSMDNLSKMIQSIVQSSS